LEIFYGSLDRLPLHEKRLLAFFEEIALKHTFEIGIRGPLQKLVQLFNLDLKIPYGFFLLLDPSGFELLDLVSEDGFLFLRKFQSLELFRNHGFQCIFADRIRWAGSRVASVVDKAFLCFANQPIATRGTTDQPAEEELMVLGSRMEASGENVLDRLEEPGGNEGLMVALIDLAGSLDANQSRIEGVVQRLREAVYGNRASRDVAEAKPVEFITQGVEREAPRRVELEGFPYERPFLGINRFRFAGALVEIADRSPHGLKALLQASVDAFLGLLSKIPDVVRGDYRLDVCREAATS